MIDSGFRKTGHPALWDSPVSVKSSGSRSGADAGPDIGTQPVGPGSVAEAVAVQEELRPLVDLVGPGPSAPATVAGLDVAYSQGGDLLAAAVTVLDARTLEVVDSAVSVGRPAFDYVPGLFAFRELPALLAALDRLTVVPDLLVCDGHGLAHPRRFGLACHLGVVTGLPAIGWGRHHWSGRGIRRLTSGVPGRRSATAVTSSAGCCVPRTA